jgi:hypothetical protein
LASPPDFAPDDDVFVSVVGREYPPLSPPPPPPPPSPPLAASLPRSTGAGCGFFFILE